MAFSPLSLRFLVFVVDMNVHVVEMVLAVVCYLLYVVVFDIVYWHFLTLKVFRVGNVCHVIVTVDLGTLIVILICYNNKGAVRL